MQKTSVEAHLWPLLSSKTARVLASAWKVAKIRHLVTGRSPSRKFSQVFNHFHVVGYDSWNVTSVKGEKTPLNRKVMITDVVAGGAASKNGVLRVGDQIITVNGCDVTVMSRIEAWNLMKKLPDGVVTLVIRQSLNPASSWTHYFACLPLN